MTPKHTLWTALFALLGLGLAGCQPPASDANDVTFSPTPFSGTTGGFVTTGGVVGSTGGLVTTGGVLGSSGGFATTGGVVGSTGGFATTGGAVGSTGGFEATGGMAAETGGAALETGGAASVGTVNKATFTVTTQSQGGRYSPRNVVAIWVEGPSGNFVKALAKHAQRRATYLSAFNSAAGIFPDLADAVTSATLSRHQQHVVTWDLTDNAGAKVAAGDYNFRIELTEKDSAGNNISVNFSTADGPGTSNPPDEQYYTDMSIVLE